ncbi:unnamed protein product, partial [Iphiclides podalirius]
MAGLANYITLKVSTPLLESKMNYVLLVLGLLVNTAICFCATSSKRSDHKHSHQSVHRSQGQTSRRSRRHWAMVRHYDNPYESTYRYDYNFRYREEEVLREIVNMLREIKLDFMTPKQQQPAFIPYFVPYPVPHQMSILERAVGRKDKASHDTPLAANKQSDKDSTTVTITLHDRNNFPSEPTDDDYMSRPIAFKPVTEAAATSSENREPGDEIIFPNNMPATVSKQPSKCQAAIIACCRFPQSEDRKRCFALHDCMEMFAGDRACKNDVIRSKIIDKKR